VHLRDAVALRAERREHRSVERTGDVHDHGAWLQQTSLGDRGDDGREFAIAHGQDDEARRDALRQTSTRGS
jgi:hypothetical protein